MESDIPPHGAARLTPAPGVLRRAGEHLRDRRRPDRRPQAGTRLPVQNAGGQQNNTYHGGGGVPVGSPLNRLLYAVKFRELNILLSGAINGDSKILYDRQPLARVAKVAPFLTLDGSPYPVVAGSGQILWVVDGYTTTDLYPYSQRVGLAAGHLDQRRAGRVRWPASRPGQINYIRNSVKAVVNAYTGQVTLYDWDATDPMLQTWMNAFPGSHQARSPTSPRTCMPHLRYPPDLFEVQRQILAQYHVLQRAGVLRRAELLGGAERSHRGRRNRPASRRTT